MSKMAETATDRNGESFVHEITTVTGPSGASWPQCTCTLQFGNTEGAEEHLESVREWQAHQVAMAAGRA